MLVTLQEIPEELPGAPLPGGVAAVFRWFFHVPQGIQIGGAIVGSALVLGVLVLLWRRRRQIVLWVARWRRPVQIAAGVAAAAVLVSLSAFGKSSWDYMMHDNDFCTGCHIMGSAFQRFTDSEHAELSCHDCHRQTIFESTRQLYLWVVERPEEIGEHSGVATVICSDCHVTADPDSTWAQIAATAGHRVHLESDSTALAAIECVSCHGQEVHRFVPASLTCGQSDCHDPNETEVVLGRMAGQTELHCITCHDFTAAVAGRVPRDTALARLVPGESRCFICHEMPGLLVAFNAEQEPHGALCGSCHDPHTQETPAAAFASCSAGGCHEAMEEATPFHRGLAHGVIEDCAACHDAHHWTVEGPDCTGCHAEIASANAAPMGRERGLAAARPTIGPAQPGGELSSGPNPGGQDPFDAVRGRAVGRSPPGPLRTVSQTQETLPFTHADHGALDCETCHASDEWHGRVTIRGQEDCFSCHHGSPYVETGCDGCHPPERLSADRRRRVALTLAVWDEPRLRGLPFGHEEHAELVCEDCHGDPARSDLVTDCLGCHEAHHEVRVACHACHEKPTEGAHAMSVHLESCAGSGCHGDTSYDALPNANGYCLSCHQDQSEHEPLDRCVRCHLLPERSTG